MRWIVHCSRYYFADFGEYRMISLLVKSLPRESSTPGLEVELLSSDVADKERGSGCRMRRRTVHPESRQFREIFTSTRSDMVCQEDFGRSG